VRRLAIDASTAAKWQLSDEPEAEQARLMLHDYVQEHVTFIVPSIWHYEVANVVNKAVSTERLTEEEGTMAFQDYSPQTRWPHRKLQPRTCVSRMPSQ
jgi:hypothetical protein